MATPQAKISFHGAAGTVTGSCHLLEYEGRQILLDCGTFQGGADLEARNAQPFGFSPKSVERVILSHAHQDHAGRLPKLVKEGFRGPIHCTHATKDISRPMILDAAHIMETEAGWKSKRLRRAGREGIEPIYTTEDVEPCLQLFQGHDYHADVDLGGGVKVRFTDAGHILGSATVELRLPWDGGERRFVFSGDIGQWGQAIIRDPEVPAAADWLVMESTYGDRSHEAPTNVEPEMVAMLADTAKTKGMILIPSFALGRTQEMLFYFHKLAAKHQLDRHSVYLDSPLASRVTEVYRAHPECFDEETQKLIATQGEVLDFAGLRFAETRDDSMRVDLVTEPRIVVAASGMCEAGRVLHHLKHNLWKASTHVVFVGFQAEGSLGRRILDGAHSVRVLGETVCVSAKLHNFSSFSAHADREGLHRWTSAITKPPRKTFIVHGEESAAATLGSWLEHDRGFDVEIPDHHDSFILD
ncbi:MAG: MBL fold metallo-hydrolase [Planctomycetes bacterium]|nr:MBL fold metallo-hydrolase [Planctomycetota bacterium]